MSGSKRPVVVSAELEDRISYLPDNILIEILSRLPLTKDAIQTSLLSKRWRPLWTQLHRLSFQFFFDRVRGVLPSTTSLASCLAQHASPTLTQLDIVVDTTIPDDIPAPYRRRGSKPFRHEVRLVLSYARKKQVEVLSLEFCQESWDNEGDDDDLQRTVRDLNTYISKRQNWISLKVLDIQWAILDNCEHLLSCFPLLESLRLHICKIDFLEITSKNLKTLVLNEFRDDGETDILVTTPSLEHLEIKISYSSDASIEFIDVSSLRKASFDLIDYDCIDYASQITTVLSELLAQLSRVEEMRLTSSCLKAISTSKIQMKVFPTLSCKYLILDICYWDRYDFPGLESVFQNSPFVEKLDLYFGYEKYYEYNSDLDELDFTGAYWKSSSATLRHLRIVHVHDFDYPKSCIEILEFLLKYAMVLEKLVVHPIKNCNILDKQEFAQELYGFPRSSTTAVIHLI